MKITYKTNVLDIIRLVENNTPALWEKEHNNFPNTWGGVNALTKQVVKDLLVMINLPYSKELAGFIRYIVECPNTLRYSEYKRSLIGKTVEDVIQVVMWRSWSQAHDYNTCLQYLQSCKMSIVGHRG